MAVKSGTAITASDLASLRTKILTMYGNRQLSVNGQQLSNTSNANYAAVNSATFIAGQSITSEGLGALIQACLVINDIPNLLKRQNQGDQIFRAGSTTNLLTWLSTSKVNAVTTSSYHGCRGACVGLCLGGCYGTNTGTTGGTIGNACNGCSYGCYNACQGGNGSGVGGVCTCTDSCFGDCYGSCKGDSCHYNCSGTCGGGCGSGCYQGCDSACQWQCINGCATDCQGGCYGTTTGGAYGI